MGMTLATRLYNLRCTLGILCGFATLPDFIIGWVMVAAVWMMAYEPSWTYVWPMTLFATYFGIRFYFFRKELRAYREHQAKLLREMEETYKLIKAASKPDDKHGWYTGMPLDVYKADMNAGKNEQHAQFINDTEEMLAVLRAAAKPVSDSNLVMGRCGAADPLAGTPLKQKLIDRYNRSQAAQIGALNVFAAGTNGKSMLAELAKQRKE
jgi:hypothetical protein